MIFSLNKFFQYSRCPVRTAKSYFSHKSKAKLFDLLTTMPKEKPHIPKMQAERQLKKTTKTKYPPGVVTLQVLGSGARGAPRSLYVFTDQSCYLFNAGEGSQRLAHEHKFKLAKVEHIFFTKTSWDNVGGLPGISLTIQDVGVPHITLHGPPGLGELFDAASRFIILKDLQVNHVDATCPESYFEDSVMKITYVPIDSSNDFCRSNSSSPFEEEDVTNYYCKETPNNQGSPAPKRTRVDLTSQRSSKSAMSYICRVHPKQGTLLAEKCVEFGVPPGPLYGQLKAGKDITLPDGKVVLAKDVRSPDDPGPVFLVVECPSEAFLENVINNTELSKFQAANGASELDSPQVVVHFTPIELVKHPKYQEWIERFAFNTKHMYLGFPENENHRRGLGSVAVHRIQHKLSLIDQEIFPLLSSDMKTEDEPETDDCQTLSTFHLRPLKKLDMTAVPRITPKTYVDEALGQNGLQASLDELKATLNNAIPLSDKSYPKFVFLGTGSCIPNKTRNTSAILVEIEKDRFMLMDCGEGTYGQIVRFFGFERANRVLSNMVGIYISHLHADHHIGLIGLLQGRERAFEFTKTNHEPAMLIAPQQINYWLKTYHQNFEKIRQCFELIPALNLFKGKEVNTFLLDKLNAESIVTTYVRHCPNAFGVSIVTADGFKFTYSGDTMPSQGLVEIGQGSDLLIHEATMEDGMEDEAKIKTHSTTSQAIEVGRSMNAKFTLLTHFSQRYSKIPKFNDQFSAKTVGIAFDNMLISPNRLHYLPFFIPVLKQMFAESYEEMEEKTKKRNLRLLREENQKNKA